MSWIIGVKTKAGEFSLPIPRQFKQFILDAVTCIVVVTDD